MSGFFCGWIPHFAAWALEQGEVALQNRAFAVCERGTVVAASPLALEAGVLAGVKSAKAQSRLSSLLLVARERGREVLAWEEVQRAFYGLTPKVEALEPGLLFAEIEPQKAARLVKAWHFHGGAASDRAGAHLAALSSPVGIVRAVKPGRERAYVGGLPLALLQSAGVGTKTLQRLTWLGWHRIGQLRALSRRQLEEQFDKDGATLFRLAQGAKLRDNLRPVPAWAPPAEIVAALSFELPAREPAHWDGALDELLRCACDALGARQAQSLEISAQTPVALVMARRVLKEPLSAPSTLRRPLENALDEALRGLLPLPPVINALELRLGALTCASVQASLFAGELNERVERPQRLRGALEGLENRFAGHLGRFAPDQLASPFPEERYGWQTALEALAKAKGVTR